MIKIFGIYNKKQKVTNTHKYKYICVHEINNIFTVGKEEATPIQDLIKNEHI